MPFLAAFRPYCGVINVEQYVNMSIYLYFTENMAMTGENCFKLLIFQSVFMTMVYGSSGSDLVTVRSDISQDVLWIIFGMFILIPYND